MKNIICPQCGNLLDETDEVCSECGCSMEIVKQQKDQEQAARQKSLKELGSIETWAQNNKNAAAVHRTLNTICTVFIVSAIIIGIAFIIYFITSGIKTNDDMLMYLKFDTQTVSFTLSVAVLWALGEIFDTAGDGYALAKCSAWLNKLNLDGAKSLELNNYQGAKKRKVSSVMLNLNIAYCAVYPDKVKSRIIGMVVETVLKAVFSVLIGIFAATAINQWFILEGTKLWNPYEAYGYTAGVIACAGAYTLTEFLFRRISSGAAEDWFLKKQNER